MLFRSQLSNMATTLRTPADLMTELGYGDEKYEKREEFFKEVVDVAEQVSCCILIAVLPCFVDRLFT